ncbi:MAG: Gfo/Idh/MocA family oxidoreductase [Pseudomonadota bacterium]
MQHLLDKRLAENRPVGVTLIGAGKFGAMFLSQVPTIEGLQVRTIVDLDIDNAKATCARVGWEDARISSTKFTDDANDALRDEQCEVVIEATGNPIAGVDHALAAIEHGKHVVMVNVEADALCGVVLAQKAQAAGVVYTMAYGDQPALIWEMVNWGRLCGFEITAAGKGTRYFDGAHQSTPDTVWEHYGLTSDQAAAAGMNSQMFNSFLDGTKSAIEMAAVCNATGLLAGDDGLTFPACGVDDLPRLMRPQADGGALQQKGQVEVIASEERDGSPVFRDLRWGVYVVFEAPNDYSADCFRQYGLNTDVSGRYASMYKPYHLIGLELSYSVFSAALRQESIGHPRAYVADAVATAKRDLKAGETLDGEGGFTVYGKLMPARASNSVNALPIGLAHDVLLKQDVRQGEIVGMADIDGLAVSTASAMRNQLLTGT